MKRILLTILLFAALPFLVSAQYRVASVDKAYCTQYELKYVLETEKSVVIYGTYTSSAEQQLNLDRTVSVIQNDIKYKVKNSVNLPVDDDAEPQHLVFGEAGEKVNFVLELGIFNLNEPFDIVERENPKEGHIYLNMYGVHLEPIELSKFPDFDAFVDSYPATIIGRYKDGGSNVVYYMRDGVYVSCRATDVDDGFLEPKYKRFLVEISNDSDHGIMFDFDKTYVMGHRMVGGKQQDKPFVKYTPDSFAEYLADSDYYEARDAVGGMQRVGDKLRSESYNSNNSEWARLGLQVLSGLANEVAEQNIQEYLASHPKNRPGVLRSQSLKSGSSISGYMAFKTQKADTYTLHIPMDGYDFTFLWK